MPSKRARTIAGERRVVSMTILPTEDLNTDLQEKNKKDDHLGEGMSTTVYTEIRSRDTRHQTHTPYVIKV